MIAFVVWLAGGCQTAIAEEGRTRTVVTADGSTFSASLVEADGRTFSFQMDNERADGHRRTMPARDLVSWGAPVESDGDGSMVLLTDGGAIIGEVVELSDEALIDSDSLGEFRAPLEALAGIVFAPPYSVEARDALADRARRAGAADGEVAQGDWLLWENNDEMTGVITKMNDRVAHIETAVGAVAAERSRVIAAGFNPALRRASANEGLRYRLGFADGSHILTKEFYATGAEARATVGGVVVRFPIDELTHVQTLGGAATYLSDLRPSSYVHVPYLTIEWPYRLDRSVTGTALRSGVRVYRKGIGMHASSRLTFQLPPGQNRLRGLIAIDDQTRGGGSVVFRVYVDSEQRFRSEIVRGGEAPLPIDVDVSGGKLVSFFVEAADGGDVLDRANWLDVRLSEK